MQVVARSEPGEGYAAIQISFTGQAPREGEEANATVIIEYGPCTGPDRFETWIFLWSKILGLLRTIEGMFLKNGCPSRRNIWRTMLV